MLNWQCTLGKLFIILFCVATSEQGILDNLKDKISDKISDVATDIHNAKNDIKEKFENIPWYNQGTIVSAPDPDLLSQTNHTRLNEGMDEASYDGNTDAWVKSVSKMFDIHQVTEDIRTSTKSKATCLACKSLVTLTRHMFKNGKSEEHVLQVLTDICTTLQVQTKRVCSGLVNLMGIDLVQAVEESPMPTAHICNFYLNNACSGGFDARHDWTVQFPPKPKTAEHPPSPTLQNIPVLKILQITDTHYDPYYQEGANNNCDDPLCCRADNGRPASAADTAGKWGDYRKCDTPLVLFENALKHIADTHKDIDYIYWTGDAPPHDIWNQTRQENLDNIKFSGQLFAKYFKGIQIFPSVGNHESCPVDSFVPDGAPPRKNMAWLYDELDRQWSRWLPSDTSETIRHGAYYSVLVRPGFRILSVNGNFCGNYNFWLLKNSNDPAGELAWLIRELDKAEANGEKVHIIGHVPPGGEDCLKVWSSNYYDIINRYEGIIMAQFFGHTHNDEFEIFYDTKDFKRPINVGYISPSITPWTNVNPSYRIYYVEGDHPQTTRAILNHETWKMDLGEANRSGNPVWQKQYDAKQAYNMTSLHPSEWDNLITRMIDDEKLFDTYYRNYHRDSSVMPKCNSKCRRKLLCDLKSGRSSDRKNLCSNVY